MRTMTPEQRIERREAEQRRRDAERFAADFAEEIARAASGPITDALRRGGLEPEVVSSWKRTYTTSSTVQSKQTLIRLERGAMLAIGSFADYQGGDLTRLSVLGRPQRGAGPRFEAELILDAQEGSVTLKPFEERYGDRDAGEILERLLALGIGVEL